MVSAPKISEVLAKKLEEMILTGVFKAGEKLPPERQLAEKFEVSRPSVREAIQLLKAKQLVTSRQGGGNYINSSLGAGVLDPIFTLFEESPKAHEDLLEYRLTLEGDCALLAAQRATEPDIRNLTKCYEELLQAYQQQDASAEAAADARFHLAIAEASHNVVFLHTIKSLFDLLERNITSTIGNLFENINAREQLCQQHQAIYEAIKTRDPELAKQKSREHIIYVQDMLDQQSEERARLESAQLKENFMS